MPANAPLRDYLLTRRSVAPAFLHEPGPNPDELRQILTIATRVPDHAKLTPWRLVVYEGEARVRAGEKLAAIARSRNPAIEEAALEIERKRFLPSPLVVGVIHSPRPNPKAPEIEQVLSTGNVAFNLIHGAAALGFGADWVTRWYCFDIEAQAMLGARAGEKFVGFIHIGTAAVAPEDRPRPVLETVVSRWQG
jgi:nitroreductase